MDENDLKDRIWKLVDEIHNRDREDTRQAIFDFVIQCFDDRKQAVRLTQQDINEIQQTAVQTMQGLSLPLYIDGQTANEKQRIAFCYLAAVTIFLKKRNLVKYLLEVNTQQPFYYSIFEE